LINYKGVIMGDEVIDPVDPVEPTESTTDDTAVDPVEPIVTNTPAVDTPQGDENTYEGITEDITIEGVTYDGVEINVNLNQDIVNSLGEVGLDAKEITDELYKSEDFTLSQETKDKLYEKFPQWQVDSYLKGVKANNDLFIANHKAEITSIEEAGAAAWEATMEVMGGEDKWDDMSAFAVETLSEEDLTAFNEIMQNGNPMVQQLLIKDMFNKFTEAGAPPAPTILDLETGDNGGDLSNSGEALSHSAYHELIKSGEYSKDPAKYDALRRLGQQKGI